MRVLSPGNVRYISYPMFIEPDDYSASLRGSLGTYGSIQKLCLKKVALQTNLDYLLVKTNKALNQLHLLTIRSHQLYSTINASQIIDV